MLRLTRPHPNLNSLILTVDRQERVRGQDLNLWPLQQSVFARMTQLSSPANMQQMCPSGLSWRFCGQPIVWLAHKQATQSTHGFAHSFFGLMLPPNGPDHRGPTKASRGLTPTGPQPFYHFEPSLGISVDYPQRGNWFLWFTHFRSTLELSNSAGLI